MTTQTLFSERQRFGQIWWIPLVLIDGLIIYKYFFLKENPISNEDFIFLIVGLLSLNLLFLFMCLDTEIKEDGIYYRFFPFNLKHKNISWDRISKSYTRVYSVWEYGGYGIRYGFNGKALNISGNKGLQLVYDNNRKLLLGTQRIEELEAVLKKLGKYVE